LLIHALDWPTIDFEMCCGRGTYVRSLIRDLGQRLGTGGCLTSLTRDRVGSFSMENAWTLESLRDAAGPSEYLTNLERARIELAPSRIVIPPRPRSCG
jgi:tRNA pseudouridine55 synthase